MIYEYSVNIKPAYLRLLSISVLETTQVCNQSVRRPEADIRSMVVRNLTTLKVNK